MPTPDLSRRQPRVRAVRLRIGRGTLVLPPLGIVLLVLVGPIVVLALYSVNLRTNIPGTPTAFSSANWKDFLTGHANPFRGRFFYSMKITLLVSVAVTAAAYPLAYYLAFVARRFRYTLLLVLIAPFFTSYLLRIVAWSDIVLNNNGVINQSLWPCTCAPTATGSAGCFTRISPSFLCSSTHGSRSSASRSSRFLRTWTAS